MSDENKESQIARAFIEFYKTIAALRDPSSGCPWDLEQDHKTLRRYMIEEAYEAAEAMDGDEHGEICDELGDVLLQVVLNAQVAQDEGKFDIEQVIGSIDAKMKRRHPHVFGTELEKQQREISQIKSKWQEIKEAEKKKKTESSLSIFEENKISKVHPATRKAYQIGKVAKKIRFDWDGYQPVLEKLKSEIDELSEALKVDPDSKEVYAELGDVYFTLAHLCRHLGHEPELVAEDGNKKFLNRFSKMEELIKDSQLNFKDLPQSELEKFWVKAKNMEKK